MEFLRKMSDWQFWIDRGVTLTDGIGHSPDGRIVIRNLLSENPESYQDALLCKGFVKFCNCLLAGVTGLYAICTGQS